MEKSNKTLSNVITVIYAVVAAGWLISSILQFRTAKGVMSISGSILYFVPLLLMLVVSGIEINRLKKEKYKVLDAVVFLILPIVMMIALVMSGVSMGSTDGDIEIGSAGYIAVFYLFKSLAAIGAGFVALILAVIKKKTEK